MCVGAVNNAVNNDAIPGDVNAGTGIVVDDIAAAKAARTGAASAPAVAQPPDAMEAIADAAISGHDITMIIDATPAVSGANGVTTAAMHQGAGIAAARIASPSTPGADSEATADGRLIDDVAVVCNAPPLAPGAVFTWRLPPVIWGESPRLYVFRGCIRKKQSIFQMGAADIDLAPSPDTPVDKIPLEHMDRGSLARFTTCQPKCCRWRPCHSRFARTSISFLQHRGGGMCVGAVNTDAISRDMNADAAIGDDGIAAANAVCTGAARAPSVAWVSNAMDAVSNAAISGDDVTTVIDATPVDSGANGVATASRYGRCSHLLRDALSPLTM